MNTSIQPPADDITKMGLLMEAAVAYQQSAEQSLNRLKTHTQGLDAIVRDEIRRTLVEEFLSLGEACQRAKQSLESIKHAAHLRVVFWSAGMTVMCVAIALTVLWKFSPTKSQIDSLRAEHDRYLQAIAQLEKRGGRIDLRRCGENNSRLCVRIDPNAPVFGARQDYRIVQGY